MFGPSAVPGSVATLFQQAVFLHQRGQLAQAKQLYEKLLSVQPKHFQALHLLGVMAFQTGNYQYAVDLIGRAIAIDPSHAAFHCNLGNALLRQKQLDAAIASYDTALRIKPDFTDALANRGVALAELLQFESAIASYDQAIAVDPTYVDAYYNRGNALLELKQNALALASHNAAIALRPDFADAYCAKGLALKNLDNLDEAVANFQQALSINPQSNAAHCNLANVLLEQGKLEESLASYLHALRLGDTAQAKRGFVQCIKRITFAQADAELTGFVIRAIAEAWTRPAQLFAPAISIVKSNPAIKAAIDRATSAWPEPLSAWGMFGDDGLAMVAKDHLLRCILTCMPIASIELERFVTQARRILLDHVLEVHHSTVPLADNQDVDTDTSDPLLALFSALAQQCFVNEYVFTPSDAELAQVDRVRGWLEQALQAQATVPGWWLAAIAAYSPLGPLPLAERMAQLALPEPVRALVKQQILEPAAERAYRPSIRQLTRIDDAVSLLVQQQYEQNPYPRWAQTSVASSAASVNQYLRQQFPAAPFLTHGDTPEGDILIAGCGTGQQSIDAAHLFPQSKILAIDLSVSSLCYAKRKTEELGIRNIDYAQADIMALGELGRSFDAIESVGVLHHLADPLAGWRVLVNLLKPGGFMRLGFYSELARKNIVDARNFIAQRGYSPGADPIRQCRQDIMSDALRHQFQGVLSFRDFFGMSECRDLLFHVQEHRYTVVQIKDALAQLGLRFIGFSLDASVSNQYHSAFPDDTSQTNLDNWHQFETMNPETFAGMYQFWVQKVYPTDL